jgi:hypothetical protein
VSDEREPIYSALFGLISQGEGLPGKITWGSAGALAYTSRRVRLWADLPDVPALCQAEHGEMFAQATRMPYKRVFSASWFFYHRVGKDSAAVPAITNNQILDAAQAILAPPPGFETQTLGGLVHHCWIEGTILKDPGDLDGDALIIVPIHILVP